MSKIHLVEISSDIVEDSFKEGLLTSTGCGLSGEKIGKTFEDMPAMLKYLSSYYGLSEELAAYEENGTELETAKAVANHSEAQNGGWFEPTEEEYALWKRGKLKLYSEMFIIKYLHVV